MRLAYFSPFNPQKSGISDYSEELLPHLAKRSDLDLFVNGFVPTNKALLQNFRHFDYRTDPATLRRLNEYDAIIYHMGNDPRYHTGIYETMMAHPGIVVFHDFAFQFFFFYLAHERRQLDLYLNEMEICHGSKARQEAATAIAEGVRPSHLSEPLSFPLNLRLAQAAEAIVVHSEWSKLRFAAIVPSTPVTQINMHVAPLSLHSQPRAASRLVQIAAFGHATPEKGIERIINALAWLKERGHAFHFTLVGEASPFFDIREMARQRGLKDQISITGYVTLDEFHRRIETTDIAINLRENPVGETSASLCRIMAAGVPAIVSEVGWFAELPNDAVVKIEANEYADSMLRAYLERLIKDKDLRLQIGDNARRHMLNFHSIEQSAHDYIAFVERVVASRTRAKFVNTVARDVAMMGLNGSDDGLLIGIAEEVAELAPPEIFQAVAAVTSTSNAHVQPNPKKEIPVSSPLSNHNGRVPKLDGIDYKLAAREYPRKLDQGRSHYLKTKPFDNLARRPPKYQGDGMDVETHRHFCDFANITRQLGLAPGSRILDVGCGSGWLSEYLARLGYDVCGIDISADLIEIARERLHRVPYPLDPDTPLRWRFQTHDVEASPLNETFDAVICYDSLHHFEDERAVIKNVAAMLEYGGSFFILEGDRPAPGSLGEQELIDAMQEFGTLESPFDRNYLFGLLREHGFAIAGDYISVNGLFQRETVHDNQLRIEVPAVTYLLCQKVGEPGSVASVTDSRQARGLCARISLTEAWSTGFELGAQISCGLAVENIGDALWLAGPATMTGAVTFGIKILNENGRVVYESHGTPPILRPLAPRQRASFRLELEAPKQPGNYQLKIDLIAQHVTWFEQVGSRPLLLDFHVK